MVATDRLVPPKDQRSVPRWHLVPDLDQMSLQIDPDQLLLRLKQTH